MKPAPSRIFVVDDHPLTRKGLCEAIAAEPHLSICGEAEGWHEALSKVVELKPDLMVLDLHLKDGNGWTLLEQLALTQQIPPTLVLSFYDEQLYAQRMIKQGARGYLMKDAPIAQVLEAIRKILAGHIAVSDVIASRMIHSAAQGPETETVPDEDMTALSDRELQVFEMLREGASNKHIADRLGISQKTIGTYKSRLMEKLGIRTSPELVAPPQAGYLTGSRRLRHTTRIGPGDLFSLKKAQNQRSLELCQNHHKR